MSKCSCIYLHFFEWIEQKATCLEGRSLQCLLPNVYRLFLKYFIFVVMEETKIRSLKPYWNMDSWLIFDAFTKGPTWTRWSSVTEPDDEIFMYWCQLNAL